MKLKDCIRLAVISACCAPAFALATNGYFSHGYGMKSKGMAGATTAMADDAFGGATNPAKMVFVGDRIDFGADLFSPRRSASRTGSIAGLNGTADSDSNYFLIPEFGYNKLISPNLSLGVTVYGNGGMNTDYPGGQIPAGNPICGGFGGAGGPYNLLCGSGKLGVDLSQLIIAPTAAFKVSANHSLGISPLFAYQRFKVDGIQSFAGFSATPGALSNLGYDSSTGWGARFGWMGKITDSVTLGAAYSTKVKMGKFSKYQGLFADQGLFDIPENYNLGLALKATPEVTLAFDYQRINYSKISSVGNPSTNFGATVASTLGVANGRGFGWSDVNVYKLGVEYAYSKDVTLRGGYNHGDNPIQARDVTINILAPGVVQDHVTLGLTFKTKTGGELTFAYMHAFSKSVSGSSLFNTFTGGTAGTETIKMSQDSLGIAYGWKM